MLSHEENYKAEEDGIKFKRITMDKIDKLIQEYQDELLNIEDKRKSDDAQGDHSYGMEYDTSEENINEFIENLKKLK